MLLNVLVVDDLVVDIRRTICAVSYFFYQARPIAVVVLSLLSLFCYFHLRANRSRADGRFFL